MADHSDLGFQPDNPHSDLGFTPDESKSWLDSASDFAKGLWSQVNPVAAVRSLATAVNHPLDTVQAMGKAQDKLRLQAEDAFDKGNYAEGARHLLSYVIPVLGPAIDAMGNKAQSGQVAEALGEATGLAGTVVAPEFAGRAAEAVAETAGNAGRSLYRTALKPRVDLPIADVHTMIETGLGQKIPISPEGLGKLGDQITALNKAITDKVNAAQNAGVTIDPANVVGRLADVDRRFAAQVNPESDLRAIDRSGDEFLRVHGAQPGKAATPPQPTGVLDPYGNPIMSPGTPGKPAVPAQPIPAVQAQAEKIGTYQQIKSQYDKLSTAQIEAQKALARGLKEELVNAIPELGQLNAAESKLLDLQPVLERAVNRAANSTGGIGGDIAGGAVGAATGSIPGAFGAKVFKQVMLDPEVRSKIALGLDAIRRGKAGVKTGASIAASPLTIGALMDQMQRQPTDQR